MLLILIFLFNNCVLHNKSNVLACDDFCFCDVTIKIFFFQLTQPKRPLYIPKYVINHGVVSGATIQNMLKESKVLHCET